MLNTRKICGRNGDLHYLDGFIQDITDKKAADKKLRDSEERYRASFEQAAVGSLHTSLDGGILRCNRRVAEMWEFARGKRVARHGGQASGEKKGKQIPHFVREDAARKISRPEKARPRNDKWGR